MPAIALWNLDPTRLLTRRELAMVLADNGGSQSTIRHGARVTSGDHDNIRPRSDRSRLA
jgi:hypothetical protein